MIPYLLKASFILGVALLFYKIVLQQETFFKVNRIYFILFLALAFVLPSIQVPKVITHQGFFSSLFYEVKKSNEVKVVNSKRSTSTIPTEVNKERSLSSDSYSEIKEKKTLANSPTDKETVSKNWFFWLLALYFFGVAVFALSLILQAFSIVYKIFKNEDKILDGSYVIVNLRHKQAPCSFFNYIFIHPDEYDLETYEQIISHEKIHAKQGHSWDLIIAELGIIILWFNPFMWIYKRELEKNIEYETDAILLNQHEVAKDQYQFNLLQISAPNKPLTITTNYNQSLLKQRILMMNAKKSTLSSYWKYTFLAPLLLGTVLFLNEPATGQKIKETGKTAIDSPEIVENKEINESTSIDQEEDGDMTEGFWYGYAKGNEYCIEFKNFSNSNQWNSSTCLPKSVFQKQENEVFILKRETGTLKLNGPLDKEVSQGKFTFAKDVAFENYLAKNDLLITNKSFMFHLFMNDVNKKYVDYFKNKYKSLSGHQLLALSIHQVDPNYIESLSKAGFSNLDVNQVVAAKIHDISPKTIQEIKALGFGELGLEKMIELKIHEVDAKYIADLKSSGFENLSLDQVIQAKIHDVNPKTIKEMQSLGFKDLSIRKMIELQIHGVNASFVEDLKSAGFKDLSLDQIIQAKIHDVSPKTIKEIQTLGFKELSLKKIIELKIHDVNAEFISDLKNAGFKDLTMDEILEARIHDVNSKTIQEIKSLGYTDLSLRKIIEANIHDVNADFIEGLKSAGFTKLDINDVIQAKIHDVDGKFIKEARDDGFDYNSIDKYINLKIHGIARNAPRKK